MSNNNQGGIFAVLFFSVIVLGSMFGMAMSIIMLIENQFEINHLEEQLQFKQLEFYKASKENKFKIELPVCEASSTNIRE